MTKQNEMPDEIWAVDENIVDGWLPEGRWRVSEERASWVKKDAQPIPYLRKDLVNLKSQSIPIAELKAWLENYIHKSADSPVGIMLEDFQVLIKEYEKNNKGEKND